MKASFGMHCALVLGQPPQGIERRKHHGGEVMGSDSNGSDNQLK